MTMKVMRRFFSHTTLDGKADDDSNGGGYVDV